MNNLELTVKEIGRLGEDFVKHDLEQKGFYVTKGYGSSPDLKVYYNKPSNNRSKLSNFLTCEVKCTLKGKFPERERKNQESNDLLAQVKLISVNFDKITYEIKYKPLSVDKQLFPKSLNKNYERRIVEDYR